MPNSKKRKVPLGAERQYNLDAFFAQLRTALIVEDDVAFAMIIRECLEGWGYSVIHAKDGVQGIKRVMVHEFDVIICDMLMPNLAGDMFYKAVERVNPQLCKRFIFMTGNHDDPKINEFIRKVRGVILWKPFQLHVLHEAVDVVEKKTVHLRAAKRKAQLTRAVAPKRERVPESDTDHRKLLG
jgi:CheY-like chemotaxis protein